MTEAICEEFIVSNQANSTGRISAVPGGENNSRTEQADQGKLDAKIERIAQEMAVLTMSALMRTLHRSNASACMRKEITMAVGLMRPAFLKAFDAEAQRIEFEVFFEISLAKGDLAG